MPLEAASFVSGLVATNPPSGDLTSQGDDHLRLVKAVLQATFPNAGRAFYLPDLATKTANYSVLVGDQNKIFLGDATAGAITFTLPVVGLFAAFSIIVVKTDATANAVNLTPSAGTMNGVASISLASQYNGAIAIWTGSTWVVQKFASNTITGITTFTDDVTFQDVVTFNQGVQFDGPLDIRGIAEFKANAIFDALLKLKPQILADGATVNWNMALGPYAEWTAAGNRTLAAPTGEEEGAVVFLKYTQDAAGSRIPTFNAAYKGPGGTVQQPDLQANAQTLYLGLVRGADDILLIRLWGSGNLPIDTYLDYDLGTVTTGAVVTQAHNLGRYPSKVIAFLENTTGDIGYSIGDRVIVGSTAPTDTGDGTGNNRGSTIGMTTTNVFFAVGNNGIQLINKTTFNSATITASRWKVILRVYA